MVKRGTIEHPKMKQLAKALNIPPPYAVGILESLWHWSARYAIQGDIGKWSDAAISEGVGWTGDPIKLIDALVQSKWVDRVRGCARLAIHDLADHADNTWKQNLKDKGLTFWNGKPARGKGKGRRTDLQKLEVNLQPTSRNLKLTSSQPPQPVACALPVPLDSKDSKAGENLPDLSTPPKGKPQPITAEPLWEKVTDTAKTFTEARGDKGKFTFAFLGKLAKENYRHLDIVIEFFNTISANYSKVEESVLWKMWRSKKMKQNYTEKIHIDASAVLKKAEEAERKQQRDAGTYDIMGRAR